MLHWDLKDGDDDDDDDESPWTHTRPSVLTPPYGGSFCRVSISMGILGNDPANTKSNEAVFLGGLSSEPPLLRNPCALRLYILISLWQDVWADIENKKLQSVQPCVLVWRPFGSIRKQEVVLTCLRITHNCLKQGAPTSPSTRCCDHYHFTHLEGVAIF
jgi:hypothetical protein